MPHRVVAPRAHPHPRATADNQTDGKAALQRDNVGLRFCYMNPDRRGFATQSDE